MITFPCLHGLLILVSWDGIGLEAVDEVRSRETAAPCGDGICQTGSKVPTVASCGGGVGEERLDRHAVEVGELGQLLHGDRPVAALVGTHHDRLPAAARLLLDPVQGQSLLLADGAHLVLAGKPDRPARIGHSLEYHIVGAAFEHSIDVVGIVPVDIASNEGGNVGHPDS